MSKAFGPETSQILTERLSKQAHACGTRSVDTTVDQITTVLTRKLPTVSLNNDSVNVGTGNQGAIKKGSLQQKAEKKMSYHYQQQPPVGVPPLQGYPVHVHLQVYPPQVYAPQFAQSPQVYAPQYAQPPQGYAPQDAQPPPKQKTGCLKGCSALCCCCLNMIACFGPYLSC